MRHNTNFTLRSKTAGIVLAGCAAVSACSSENQTAPLPDVEIIHNQTVDPAPQTDYRTRERNAIDAESSAVSDELADIKGKRQKAKKIISLYCEAGAMFQRERQIAYDRADYNYTIRTSGISEVYSDLLKNDDVTDITPNDETLKSAVHDACPEAVLFTNQLPQEG